MGILIQSVAITTLCLVLAACSVRSTDTVPGSGRAVDARPVAVVTTFSILSDIARVVGGDRARVTSLVGAGQDAHTFLPSPADAGALLRADLVIEHGLGFDAWLERLFLASGSRARRTVATSGIEPFRDGTEVDPHLWHDPRLVGRMALTLAQTYAEHDPPNEAAYRARASRYVAELAELDTWIASRIETIPPNRRKLVTNHDSLGYFARRYGFTVIGTVLGAVSTEASEPSAATIADVTRSIRAAGVSAIFAENVSNPRILTRIAQDSGVTLAPSLYTDALDTPGGQADSYIKMMRYNVEVIVQALGTP